MPNRREALVLGLNPAGYGIVRSLATERVEFIVAESARILEALEHRGLASLEFKVCQADGRHYFIEMNPRLPWDNSLFADAGVNLAYPAFPDLTQEAAPGGHRRNSTTASTGWRSRMSSAGSSRCGDRTQSRWPGG